MQDITGYGERENFSFGGAWRLGQPGEKKRKKKKARGIQRTIGERRKGTGVRGKGGEEGGGASTRGSRWAVFMRAAREGRSDGEQ